MMSASNRFSSLRSLGVMVFVTVLLSFWSVACTPPDKKTGETTQEKTTDGGDHNHDGDHKHDGGQADDKKETDGGVADDTQQDEPPVKKSSAPVPEGFVNTNVFVDTSWLEKNLGEVRVLDIRTKENYEKGHIPGAVHFPKEYFLRKVGEIPNVVIDAETFSKHLGKAGIKKETTIVVVDDGNMLWGSRLHWTLEYFGLKARSLHGGYAAWVKDERKTTSDVPTVEATEITVKADEKLISTYANLLKRIQEGDKTLIVLDSRSEGEYNGTDARSKHGGHIKGAVHVDWAQHLVPDSNPPVLKSVDALKKLYADKGVTKDKDIASYCQTAIRATHAYLVLKALGFEKLRIYDGSWAEWGNKDDSPKGKKE